MIVKDQMYASLEENNLVRMLMVLNLSCIHTTIELLEQIKSVDTVKPLFHYNAILVNGLEKKLKKDRAFASNVKKDHNKTNLLNFHSPYPFSLVSNFYRKQPSYPRHKKRKAGPPKGAMDCRSYRA